MSSSVSFLFLSTVFGRISLRIFQYFVGFFYLHWLFGGVCVVHFLALFCRRGFSNCFFYSFPNFYFILRAISLRKYFFTQFRISMYLHIFITYL